MTQTLRALRVRVPCSTSNLGSGFDVLGLALRRYLTAELEPGGSTLEVVRTGTLDDTWVPSDRDLLVMAFEEALREAGIQPAGMLKVHSDIPVARGLGSSAAALVAGYTLAQGCMGWDADQDAAFHFATEREGHGDNAAPCALGGFRAVVPGPNGPRSLALALSDEIGFAYAAPSTTVSTEKARNALPGRIPHGRAVDGLGRLTTLLLGMGSGDPELIRSGMEDRLHVPYRLPFIPGGRDVMDAATDAGAWAVTVSGSGSGLLAVCAPADAERIAGVMRAGFDAAVGDGASMGFALEPDHEGVRLER